MIKNITNLKWKIVLYTYMIVTPILLFIAFLLFLTDYRKIEATQRENYLYDVQNVALLTTSFKDSLKEYGTYITINDHINKLLTSKDAADLNQNENLWDENAPMNMIEDMISLGGVVKTLAIYPENGLKPYLKCLDMSSHLPFSSIKGTSSYEKALSSSGRYFWTRAIKESNDFYESIREEKIVIFREINSISRDRQLGYLVIGANASSLDEITQTAIRSNYEALVICNQNGEILSESGAVDSLNYSLVDETLNLAFANNCRDGYLSYGSFDRIGYYCYADSTNDLAVIKFVPQTEHMSVIYASAKSPLIFMFGILLGLLPVLVIISNMVTKPLGTLRSAMKQFQKGDFTQQVEVTTKDEIGEVSKAFNHMVTDMKELIDKNYILTIKEKESEMDVLLAQINPHFLYNTLDSLYWRVVDTGNEDIADDILALSDLFRLALSRGKSIVPVRNETDLLEKYLQIQNMRFGKRLHYTFDIAKDIWDAPIPKLILQPFVENAVVHGFEKDQDIFELSIKGYRDNGYLHFSVCDNGAGMDFKTLNGLFTADDKKYSGQRIGRFAIKNIKERLSILYGEDYTLTINSEKNQGCEVILIIPERNEDEDFDCR